MQYPSVEICIRKTTRISYGFLSYRYCVHIQSFSKSLVELDSNQKPIHIYCQYLWEHMYKWQFSRLWGHFITPLYALIFNKIAPEISNESMSIIGAISDWYVTREHTYMRIYGATKPTSTPNICTWLISYMGNCIPDNFTWFKWFIE